MPSCCSLDNGGRRQTDASILFDGFNCELRVVYQSHCDLWSCMALLIAALLCAVSLAKPPQASRHVQVGMSSSRGPQNFLSRPTDSCTCGHWLKWLWAGEGIQVHSIEMHDGKAGRTSIRKQGLRICLCSAANASRLSTPSHCTFSIPILGLA